MSEEELEWLLDIATPTGISYSGDQTITIDFANKVIETIKEQDKKIEKYKNGLLRLLELNKFMINCDSEKVRMRTIMKQYRLIYEILGIPEPGLSRGTKNNLDKEK